jgi:5-methyltetrahydropteroyltriglutamate--homocysteine methyltransferase
LSAHSPPAKAGETPDDPVRARAVSSAPYDFRFAGARSHAPRTDDSPGAAMTTRPTPPFRADHVGSFLRPKRLLEARDKKAKGEITAEQLRAVEDDAIREIVKFQEGVGLQSITDGEFRRTYFHIDFLEQLGGVKTDIPVTIRKPDGTEELAPPVMRVVDKVRHVKDIQKADFDYLKSQVSPGKTPKVTIPSPTMLHFRGGRAGISKDHYPDLEPFYQDVANAYGDELRSLAAAGCTYVQMDDTNLAYLCDDKMREAARSRGDDPDELPHRYASFINRVVAQKPAGMTLCVHLCRGNFKSTWAAQGGYEPVAEALLSEMHVDGYFLEYDDARSGDFKPLRFLPKGKTVVLGLVTTKLGQLENKDDLKRRIDEAAKFVPLEQLCLSPQCGFSSTVHGNAIAVEAQRAKLALVVETAREVWG